MANMSLEFNHNPLLVRADYLKKVRSFFDQKKVIEVDTPLLCEYPNIDAHIELFQLSTRFSSRYLHTSPEFGMKRLLALLKCDIYQMSHVFRAFEFGKKHNPEFMMIEWYRIGKNLDFLIEETLELIHLFVPKKPVISGTYFDFFFNSTGIDLTKAHLETLQEFCKKESIATPENCDFYGLVDLIFSLKVEANFKGITLIKGFPHWQKALAKLHEKNGHLIASRFEIYFNHFELANGYDELLDPIEQKKRFEEVNEERLNLKKPIYPLDPRFLEILPQIPPCVGVAVGFDRLLQIKLQAKSLSEIIPFDFSQI